MNHLLRVLRPFLFSACTLLFFSQVAFAQTSSPLSPTYGPAFLQDEVATVEVILAQEDWDYILHPDNAQSYLEHPATFIYTSTSGSDTVFNVGFRLRGNTSRTAGKKSFKVSINSFVAGRKWNQLEKLNLNGEHNDPSILRSRLGWEMMREEGLAAPRCSHVKLYVNDEYRGLYLNSEHVDENFLARRFNTPSGKLWKCTYPADLSYQGSDPEDYTFNHPWDDTRVYDLTNNGTGFDVDYTSIANLATVLQSTPTSSLACEIEQIFDVDAFLHLTAIEILLGHWDNYTGNMNNYFLYERPEDGRLMMLSYDIDNCLGVWWSGDWANANPFTWNNGQTRPLYERLMEIPRYRDQLGAYINEALQNGFDATTVSERGSELISLCSDAAISDTFRTLDYGFSNDDFLQAMSSTPGGHVNYGVAPYIQQRSTSVLDAISPISPLHFMQTETPEPVHDDTLRIRTNITGTPSQVVCVFSLGGASSFSAPMALLADGVWGVNLGFPGEDFVEWRVESTFNIPNATPEVLYSPCDFTSSWISWSQAYPMVINEAMPLNNSFNQDSNGGFPDWVEIYTTGNSPASVSGLFLTDRLSSPSRYIFPAFTMEPDDHRLIYLDGDPQQGPLHADFHINGSGDDLTLLTWDTFGWRVLDRLVWSDAIPPNSSIGRHQDGSPEWTVFLPNTASPPTPLSPNSGITSDPCPQDLNLDGSVTVQDVLLLLSNFGCSAPEPCLGDTDGDNYVGVSDVLDMLSTFGSNC